MQQCSTQTQKADKWQRINGRQEGGKAAARRARRSVPVRAGIQSKGQPRGSARLHTHSATAEAETGINKPNGKKKRSPLIRIIIPVLYTPLPLDSKARVLQPLWSDTLPLAASVGQPASCPAPAARPQRRARSSGERASIIDWRAPPGRGQAGRAEGICKEARGNGAAQCQRTAPTTTKRETALQRLKKRLKRTWELNAPPNQFCYVSDSCFFGDGSGRESMSP